RRDQGPVAVASVDAAVPGSRAEVVPGDLVGREALPLGPRGLTLVRLDGEAAQHLQRARSDLTPVGRGVLAGELPVVSVSHRGHTVRPVTGGDGAGREVRVAPEVRVDARSGLQYEVVEQVVLSVDVSDAAVLV